MSLRAVVTLVTPGVAILLPVGVWLRVGPGLPYLSGVPAVLPFLALAAAAGMALHLRRSRVIAAAIALAIVHAMMGPGGILGTSVPVGLAAAVLAPLFAALALTADRRVGAPRAWLQVAAAPTVALLGAAAVFFDGRIGDPEVSTLTLWLARTPLDGWIANWGWLIERPVVRAVPGLGALVLLAVYRRRVLDGTFLWAATAGTLALASPDPSWSGAWVFAGAVVLGFGLGESWYIASFRDELTDLPGKRALANLLETLEPPYTIAIVDVDRLQSINDRYGHDVGDQILRKVASHLRSLPEGARAFRSTGEEFTLVFPETAVGETGPILEDLRTAIADSAFTVRGSVRPFGTAGATRRGRGGFWRKRRLQVTVGIGAATSSQETQNAREVLESADAARRRAKASGRSSVVIQAPEPREAHVHVADARGD